MNEPGRHDHYFKFVGLFLVFLLIAFNQDLALIYLSIMFVDYIWFKSDNFISFPLSRGRRTNPRVYIEALIGLGIFLTLGGVLLQYSGVQSIAAGLVAKTQSLFQLLSAATPALKESKILTFLGWGVLVPVIETTFWNGRLLEGFAEYARLGKGQPVSLRTPSLRLVVVVVFVALLFVVFHLASKGTASTPLLITFAFSLISSLLVLRHKELKGAILFHVIVNSAAVLSLPLFTA